MPVNYDAVANFYDLLSRLVFGKSIIQSQQFLVASIPDRSSVLIVGGGTGWILEEIAIRHPQGLDITYVEASKKMIAKSRKRSCGNNKVFFIQDRVQQANLHQLYDIVLTPFLFDNFSEATATIVFKKLHGVLKKDGLWLFVDFNTEANKQWQKVLLKVMYLFFRTLSHIEATSLPDMEQKFKEHQYLPISERCFFKNFIRAIVYKKWFDKQNIDYNGR